MIALFRRVSLAQWMIGAAIMGVALGFAAPDLARQLTPISDIFLRLIRAIIAPLLFGVLVRAVAGAGEIRHLGRIGLKFTDTIAFVTRGERTVDRFAGIMLPDGSRCYFKTFEAISQPTDSREARRP